MNRRHLEIVEKSIATMGVVTLEMGEAFYDTLFERAPQLRTLFSRDRMEQAMRFSEVLAYILSNLRAPERVLPVIRQLGARHRALGVVDEHFSLFKVALLATLETRLGSHWTPDVAAAWSATCDMVATEMMQE